MTTAAQVQAQPQAQPQSPRVASARSRESTRLALVAKAALERQGWQVGDRLTDEARDAIGALWEAMERAAWKASRRASRPDLPWDHEDACQSIVVEFPYIVHRYDPTQYQFLTYARRAFRHQAKRAKDEESRTIRLPANVVRNLNNCYDDVIRRATVKHRSDGDFSAIPCPGSIATDDAAAQLIADQSRKLAAAIGRLPRRYRYVLMTRYGLEADGYRMTYLKDIAATLGVTSERARQLTVKAEAKVRKWVGSDHTPPKGDRRIAPTSRDRSFLERATEMPDASAKKVGESLGYSQNVVSGIIKRTGFISPWVKARQAREAQQVA